ncbi:MAG: amidohydrolase family protein [Actinobacteria bacterium]|nr:amidohydrolase family protein [Actinomycetota bacterium]
MIPMVSNVLLREHTVVVERGRIKTVAPTASMQNLGYPTFDGSRQFLFPGLADMHVHFGSSAEIALNIAKGITTVRNMFGGPDHLGFGKRVRAGEIPGPNMITTSPLVDGLGEQGATIWPGSAFVTNAEEAAPLVSKFKNRGYAQLKVYSLLTLDLLQSLGKAARHHDLPMVGHCPNGVTFEEAIDAGISCFEHLTGILNGRFTGTDAVPDSWPWLSHLWMSSDYLNRIDWESLRRVAGEMAERGVWNCPTITVWQGGWTHPDEATNDERLQFLPQAVTAEWADYATRWIWNNLDATPLEWKSHRSDVLETLLRIVGVLYEEGAPLLVGTDYGNAYTFPGFSLHDELKNLARAGIPTYEVLRAATSEAARFVGQETEWGTIQPGKRADFILTDNNPLQSLDALQAPRAVVVNGMLFDEGELENLLSDVRAAAQSSSLPEAPVLEGPSPADTDQVFRPKNKSLRSAIRVRSRAMTPERLEVAEASVSGADFVRVAALTFHQGTLISAKWRTHSFGGYSTGTIEAVGKGFRVAVTDPDDYEWATEVTSEAIGPGESIAVAAWSAVLKRGIAVEPMLADVNQSELQLARGNWESSRTDGDELWTLSVDKAGTFPRRHQFRLSEDGTIEMSLAGYWGQPIEYAE